MTIKWTFLWREDQKCKINHFFLETGVPKRGGGKVVGPTLGKYLQIIRFFYTRENDFKTLKCCIQPLSTNDGDWERVFGMPGMPHAELQWALVGLCWYVNCISKHVFTITVPWILFEFHSMHLFMQNTTAIVVTQISQCCTSGMVYALCDKRIFIYGLYI